MRVGAELASFAALLAGNQVLSETLGNPGIPASAKRKVVGELSTRLSHASPFAKVLLMLAERDRLGLLADLNDVYQERLREHQQILQAEVTTAMPLEGAQSDALLQRLQQATGQHITLTTKVDPALIGGLVARIGSTVYDGSVSTRLTKMRERLLKER